MVRPNTKRCTVILLRDRAFTDYSPAFSRYAPPAACPGPWSKVILDFDTHVRGVQYDRYGALWIGRDEIYRATTAEPTRRGIAYHVDKDVTEYSPVFRSPHQVTAWLGNIVNKEYTGALYVSATLTFFETGPAARAAPVPDIVLPIDGSGQLPWNTSGRFSKPLTELPRNIVRATLDVYASNHACDEFWYVNQPDAYAAAHKKDGLCGGGAYREIDVWVDGRIANVVYPFPYIWTGGINPMLWRPLSAIGTLNVPAYEVDLDPWAGVLADGKPHVIGLSVMNDRGTWPLDANLLLWTDARRRTTGGAVVSDTLSRSVATTDAQRPSPAGERFWSTAARDFEVKGYVDTSHGRVWHTIEDTMRFWNSQLLNLATGEQDGTQGQTFTIATTTSDAQATTRRDVTFSYSLVANSVYPPPEKMKPYTLVIEAEVHQRRQIRSSGGGCDETVDATAVLKRLEAHVDALARGRTSETNTCSGAYGSYSIRKTAVNGSLIVP